MTSLKKLVTSVSVLTVALSSVALTSVACSKKEPEDNIQLSVPSTPTTPSTPANPEDSSNPNNQPVTPETPVEPDVPVDPDVPVTPDVPVDPETPVEPEVPVKTQEEFKQECKEILVTEIEKALNDSNRFIDYSNVEILEINMNDGVVYATADATRETITNNYFFEINTNLEELKNIDSFETLKEELNSFEINNIERYTKFIDAVSEEVYNTFVEKVLEEVNLEGAQIINVTEILNTHDGTGQKKNEILCIKNQILYKVEIRGSSVETEQEKLAKELTSETTTTYEVTYEQNFIDFETLSDAQQYFNSLNSSNTFCSQTINGKNVDFAMHQAEDGKFVVTLA